MLLGDRDAIEPLRKSAALRSHDAAIWNDLAVAQHAAATAGPATLLADALGSVQRALRERSDFPEARFNEALIFESLGLNARAAAGYERYLELDAGSEWALEAAERLAALRRPTASDEWSRNRVVLDAAALAGDRATVRKLVARHRLESRSWAESVYLGEWGKLVAKGDRAAAAQRLRVVEAIARELAALNGDTLLAETVAAIAAARDETLVGLARGHALYLEARMVYHNRDVAKALPLFHAAERELRALNTPAWRAAASYRATALHDVGRTDEAMEELTTLLRDNARDHHSLRAQLLWSIGNVHVRLGRLHEALVAHRESLALFERLGEERNACAMLNGVSGLLATLGRRGEAWEMRREAFARISRHGDVREMQKALELAARTEAQDERWDVALPLLAVAAEAHRDHNPVVYASTLLWHALAEQRLGRRPTRDGLQRAMRSVEALRDPIMRERARLDLTLAEAVSLPREDAQRSAFILDRYLEESTAAGRTFFHPEAHLQRAIRAIELREERHAEAALRTALRLLAQRETNPVEQRATYFRTGEEATRRLVELLVRRGDVAAAFHALAEGRSRPYGGAKKAGARSADFVIVEYLVLADRLFVFAAFRDVVTVRSVAVGEPRLREAAEQFIDAVASGNDAAPAADLSMWLLGAVSDHVRSGRHLVIVPDRLLARVPFAALPVFDGRLLVEHCAIALAPSSALTAHGRPRSDGSVLAVGDPALDARLFDLPRLPRALREVEAIRARYREAESLTGVNATRERVLAAASRATLLHLATHAVVVSGDPTASYLVLAPSGESSGALSVRDIHRTTLDTSPLVVLAGCRTGDSEHDAPRVTSLATAFLAAGAATVLGTLRDLPDDAGSVDLLLQFHDELRHGRDPADALRTAQLAMLNSADARRRAPSRWSTFQLYTRVPPTH